ncbi:GNAT family N-acetyltransferase [Sphingomonas sp. R86520]|uniref:GNAT family N-acetyltransferase n=1 Tax=Sphingomonas sp. R86520 TaxID=3093859 RepID=UPI0036D42EC9
MMVELLRDRPSTTEPATTVPGDTWSADLVTRSGYAFHVRPAMPSDEMALGEFFTHVDKEDLRFRFLTAIQKVGHDQLQALVTVDHQRTENFLAIEPGTGLIIATAMLAADETLTNAEVAIAIRADFKRGGISWTLLDHVARFAVAKGIKTVESIESRDNHEAIELERERGWTASGCPGDPTVMVLRKTLDVAAT